MSESTGPAEPTTTPAKPPAAPRQRSAEPKPPKAPKPAKVKKPRDTGAAGASQGGHPVHRVRRRRCAADRAALLPALRLIPRWWSQAVGRQVGGRISAGILIGLLYGFVFTFLPLIVLAQARHRAFSWPAKAIIVLVAAALTAPNLMTLGIAVGNGAAARAGNRTLDVMAPAFRQATLWGVVLGAVAAVVVVTFSILWERRSRELKLLRAQVDQLQKDATAGPPGADRAAEGPDGAPDPDLLGFVGSARSVDRAESDRTRAGSRVWVVASRVGIHERHPDRWPRRAAGPDRRGPGPRRRPGPVLPRRPAGLEGPGGRVRRVGRPP